MNILYLNTTYRCGGAEKVTSQLFHGMQSRGHQVYQIASYNTSNAVLPENVHVLYTSLFMRIFNRLITWNHGNRNLHIWYSRFYIFHFIKKHHIDIVHLHNPHDNFLGIQDISDISQKVPMVWTLHDFWAMTGHCTYPHGCDNRWLNGCQKCPCLSNYPAIRKDIAEKLFRHKTQIFNHANIFYTVPSKWMQQQFYQSHLSNQTCICIYNSININQWKTLDKTSLRKKYNVNYPKKIIAFIAADPKKKLKGMDYLLDALTLIQNPENYLLIIAGRENTSVNILNSRFQILHFGYLDTIEKLNEFYSLADVLINPSVYETFGLTNIEAMASGTPVIAFPICTMPEILDNSCGWLASDVSARALSGIMQVALSDGTILSQKGQYSRKKIESFFSESDMLIKFENLYQELIKTEKYQKGTP